MNTQIIHLPNLETTEEAIISIRDKNAKKPPFTMIGTQMKALDIIAQFSAPEAFTFIKLKDNRNYDTNIVEFSTNHMTAMEKNKFSKGYQLLSEKGLIKRLKKGNPSIYMFNPNFIIPNKYAECLNEWNALNKV